MGSNSFFLSNEELVKKDDDHKPTKLPPIRQWNPARVPPRKTIKRLLVALTVGLFVYLFIHNIPTDAPIRHGRRPIYTSNSGPDGPPESKPMPKLKPGRPIQPHTKPSKPVEKPAPAKESSSYNGPVIFPHLAVSLQSIYSTRGSYEKNKNVLFAVSSLKSAAALLPMACQMGAELRSYVHFALMSRSEISLTELRTVNGVDDSCEVIFHDARPDRPASSTETRLKTGVARAVYHIHRYMHPQAVFVDGSDAEEDYFVGVMRAESIDKEFPLIELPKNSFKRLGWMTKLDASSLAAWNKVSVDILIHAPPTGSGSLIRLLKSLSAADFTVGGTPHLTIELPHKVDPHTTKFLETFKWPPAGVYNPTNVHQLTLRHRIPRNSLTEEESSVRLLESFWPKDPRYSHILVLSPQVELSPRFFHYLKYAVLEYSLSNAALFQEWDTRLLGISLDLPSTYLNGSTAFEPPLVKKEKDVKDDLSVRPKESSTPFLWQSPNSNAVLYMGQKWVEMHDLVSRTLEAQHRSDIFPQTASFFTEKSISKRYPAWLEYALKLSRARGYWTLYPSKLMASRLATVHNELYKAPEEYNDDQPPSPNKPGNDDKELPQEETVLASGPLFDSSLLPAGDASTLVPFNDMPLLRWDGSETALEDLDEDAGRYAAEFRRLVGGCERLEADELMPRSGSVRDLFCETDSGRN